MTKHVIGIHDIIIRPATNRDKERVLPLVVRTLQEIGFKPDFETSEADLKDIKRTYQKSGGMFALVEDIESGALLGTFGVQRLDGETCKLRKMYLVPHLRGIGLGRYMLDHAIADARWLGYTTMWLETVSVLKAAIRLYTRAGFELVEQGALSPRCDQVYSLRFA